MENSRILVGDDYKILEEYILAQVETRKMNVVLPSHHRKEHLKSRILTQHPLIGVKLYHWDEWIQSLTRMLNFNKVLMSPGTRRVFIQQAFTMANPSILSNLPLSDLPRWLAELYDELRIGEVDYNMTKELSPVWQEIMAIFQQYDQLKALHNHSDSHDAEDWLIRTELPDELTDQMIIFFGFYDFNYRQIILLQKLETRTNSIITCELKDQTYYNLVRKNLSKLNLPITKLPVDKFIASIPKITALTTSNQIDEVKTIFRIIKNLRLNEVAPKDIILVLRNIYPYQHLLEHFSHRYRIPMQLRQENPNIRHLINELATVAEIRLDFNRNAVLKLLKSSKQFPMSDINSLEAFAIKSNLIGGCDDWLRVLSLWNNDRRNIFPKNDPRIKARFAVYEKIRDLLQTIRKIPMQSKLPTIALQISKVYSMINPDTETLNRTIKRLQHYFPSDAIIAFADAVRLLTDLLKDELPQTVRDTQNAVKVIDFNDIRQTHYDYVIIAGCTADNIPDHGQGHILLDSKFRSAINTKHQSERLKPIVDKIDEERLLFHYAVSSADKALYLLRPLRDGDDNEIPSSPLYVEYLKAYNIQESKDDSFPIAEVDIWQDASSSPTIMQLIDNNRFNLVAHHANAEDTRTTTPKLRWGHILGGLQYDFSTPLSITRIEAYLTCPFQFFSKFVLKLKEPDAIIFDPKPYVIGNLAHHVLYNIFKQYHKAPDVTRNSLEVLIADSIADALKQPENKHVLSNSLIWKRRTEELRSILFQYVTKELEVIKDNWLPTYFELAFGAGQSRGTPFDSKSTRQPYCLKLDTHDLLIQGRIDRVDKSLDGKQIRLVDYKYGNTPAKSDIEQGYSLQLQIYAMAIKELFFPDAENIIGEYHSITKGDKITVINYTCLDDVQVILEQVTNAVQGISNGQFSPEPVREEICNYCAYKEICRYYVFGT